MQCDGSKLALSLVHEQITVVLPDPQPWPHCTKRYQTWHCWSSGAVWLLDLMLSGSIFDGPCGMPCQYCFPCGASAAHWAGNEFTPWYYASVGCYCPSSPIAFATLYKMVTDATLIGCLDWNTPCSAPPAWNLLLCLLLVEWNKPAGWVVLCLCSHAELLGNSPSNLLPLELWLRVELGLLLVFGCWGIWALQHHSAVSPCPLVARFPFVVSLSSISWILLSLPWLYMLSL